MIKRIAMLGAVAALGVSGAAVPAIAATHAAPWTTAKCTSWRNAALKRDHNKPNAKQIASANKSLARHGCKISL